MSLHVKLETIWIKDFHSIKVDLREERGNRVATIWYVYIIETSELHLENGIIREFQFYFLINLLVL